MGFLQTLPERQFTTSFVLGGRMQETRLVVRAAEAPVSGHTADRPTQ